MQHIKTIAIVATGAMIMAINMLLAMAGQFSRMPFEQSQLT